MNSLESSTATARVRLTKLVDGLKTELLVLLLRVAVKKAGVERAKMRAENEAAQAAQAALHKALAESQAELAAERNTFAMERSTFATGRAAMEDTLVAVDEQWRLRCIRMAEDFAQRKKKTKMKQQSLVNWMIPVALKTANWVVETWYEEQRDKTISLQGESVDPKEK